MVSRGKGVIDKEGSARRLRISYERGAEQVDKVILIEYADIREEVKDLRRRIEKSRREIERLQKTTVADSVACGRKGKKPLRTARVEGRPVAAISRKERALEKKLGLLETLEAKLLERQNEVEEYIQGIEKSELRTMFRLYYIDDLTWYQVALKMNEIFPKRKVKYTEDSCWRKNKRFFENVGSCRV